MTETTTEMRTIDDVIAEADDTTTEAPAYQVRPLVIDEYPLNDEDGSINVYMYAGEDVATVSISDKPSSYDPETDEDDGVNRCTAIDTYWNEDNLYELAMTCVRALRKIGTRGARTNLAGLVREASDELMDLLDEMI